MKSQKTLRKDLPNQKNAENDEYDCRQSTGPPQEVECADDREVVATAMQMKNGLDMEIWDHKRFVIRLSVSVSRGARRHSE